MVLFLQIEQISVDTPKTLNEAAVFCYILLYNTNPASQLLSSRWWALVIRVWLTWSENTVSLSLRRWPLRNAEEVCWEGTFGRESTVFCVSCRRIRSECRGIWRQFWGSDFGLSSWLRDTAGETWSQGASDGLQTFNSHNHWDINNLINTHLIKITLFLSYNKHKRRYFKKYTSPSFSVRLQWIEMNWMKLQKIP